MQPQFVCAHKRPAKMACIEAGCTKYPLDCLDRKCCGVDHSSCQKIKVEKLEETISEGADRIARISEHVKRFYLDMIKELESDLVEWEELEQNVLHQKTYLIQAQSEQIHSRDIAKIYKKYNFYSKSFEEESKDHIDIQSRNIQNELNNVKIAFQQQLMGEKQKSSSRNSRNSRNSSSMYNANFTSSILAKEDDRERLIEMLNAQDNVHQINLLYRASQNNFSVLKFHELCNKKSNTLVLVKTSKNAIYGGFTPCAWESNETGLYKTDSQKLSYVFSTNNWRKYHLVEPEYAIECHSLFGPIFGRRGIIMILDNADQAETYWQDLPHSYMPENDTEWTKDGYKELIGTEQGENYTLLEWQVFEILFE